MAAARPGGHDFQRLADQANSVLLTASCTTGWLDWVHGTLWWVPWNQMRDAALRRGLTVDRLRVTLHSGEHVKFLWLPNARVTQSLQRELSPRLGHNLRVDRWLWRAGS